MNVLSVANLIEALQRFDSDSLVLLAICHDDECTRTPAATVDYVPDCDLDGTRVVIVHGGG